MKSDNSPLLGRYVRLEALEYRHIEGLVAAAEGNRSLYQWSPVPQTQYEAKKYVDTALAWKDAGTAVPYATIRLADNRVIGSTRFWNIERWPWPEGHPSYGRKLLTFVRSAIPGCISLQFELRPIPKLNY